VHIVCLSIVLACERLSVHNWQYSRLVLCGFCLGLCASLCVRFRSWPGWKVKRQGVPSKANEPVYTHPYACPSQHQVVTIRDAVTMPERVTLDAVSLYRGRMWLRGVHWVHCVTVLSGDWVKCDTLCFCYGWLGGGVHVLSGLSTWGTWGTPCTHGDVCTR